MLFTLVFSVLAKSLFFPLVPLLPEQAPTLTRFYATWDFYVSISEHPAGMPPPVLQLTPEVSLPHTLPTLMRGLLSRGAWIPRSTWQYGERKTTVHLRISIFF